MIKESVKYEVFKFRENEWICIATAIERTIDFKVTGVGGSSETAIADADNRFLEVLGKLSW